MASPIMEQTQSCFSDVRKVGYLRKPKSMHKRFFVLRALSAAGPSRLEYYESEKKWRHKSAVPKRSIPLESCFNINKRADSKNKYLVALYTKDEYFAIAADTEQEQDVWYQALVDLHNRGKVHDADAVGGGGGGGSGMGGEENYDGETTTPGPAFKEVWQVILKPKGLGHTKNLIGIYRLCLTNKTISFVKLNSDAAAVVLQLMNIRRCGHSEHFFFIEVGRSAVTGPGEFWMQVDDTVVAQNMHETILEAMKAMSEEFRPRSKSQSSSNCSNPISVPLRRHHHNNPPPSQVGLGRRSRTESVTLTATSPAGPVKHSHSFRVRASSDGEGSMFRPASVEGSPGSPSGGARTQSHRHRGGASSRLHPPLNHSRSIPMPSSCCSPSAISPVSLSSSGTSGHGSTSECLYPRRSSASVSGSPSDGGFISSDEYGSSPCDFRSSFRSVTPDSLGHTPPARGGEDELNNYICMAKPVVTLLSGHGHGGSHSSHPRGTGPPSRLDAEPELEKCFRKRTHSSGTSPPPQTVCHQTKTPSQSSSAVSLEEYTVMTPAYSSCTCASSYRHSAFMPTHSYPEEILDIALEGNEEACKKKDDGYMPMSPGVVPAGTGKNADYMPMSPKSVSAPQQIINPRQHPRMDSNGYMMMSPSASCSPDTTLNYSKIWANGVNPKLSVESTEGGKVLSCGDYMNMSPASCSTTSTPPPDCYFNPVEEPSSSRPMYAYFSLPRSFKHANRKQDQSPRRGLPPPSSGSRLVFGGDSSSSASSDSLRGGQGGNNPQPAVKPPKRAETTDSSRPSRPTRLFLGGSKASTLPRAREAPFPPSPKSPGEYVNIEFNDNILSANLATLFTPVLFSGSSGPERPAPELSTEYMNMHLGAQQGRGAPPPSGVAAQPPAPCTGDSAVVATPAPPPSSSVILCESLRGLQDYSRTQVLGDCAGYSDTAQMMLNTSLISTIDDVTPCPLLPPGQALSSVLGVGGPGAVSHLGLMGPLSGLSAFTRVNSSPSPWNQGAKVIRADQQGRRRHSSETFSSTGSAKGAGVNAATPSGVEEVKRHSSTSFENVWLKPAAAEAANTAANGRRGETLPCAGSAQNQNQNLSLNYIDLDLAKDQPHLGEWSLSFPQARPVVELQGGGSPSEDLSAYASISFQKGAEESLLRNPTHREE